MVFEFEFFRNGFRRCMATNFLTTFYQQRAMIKVAAFFRCFAAFDLVCCSPAHFSILSTSLPAFVVSVERQRRR